MSEAVVYAVAAGWRVKIGFTANLEQRLKEIQAMCPVPLELLATVPGGRAREAALHREFAGDRVHGEWFELTKDDRARLLTHFDGEPIVVKLPRAGRRQMLPERYKRTRRRR